MTFSQKVTIHIDKSNLKEYDDLAKKTTSPFFGQRYWKIFLMAMLTGYLNKSKVEMQGTNHDLFQAGFLKENEEWVIKSLVIVHSNSLLPLSDEKEVLKIAEEYANGGIGILHDIIFGSDEGDPLKKLDSIAKEEISKYKEISAEDQGEIPLYNWVDIISEGENELVEFKSSLRWDYKENKTNKNLEHAVAKTISAFLNSKGGKLFIGVDDDGHVLGLKKDYKTLGNKQNKDGFSLKLKDLINNYMGKEVHGDISIKFDKIDENEFCIVQITPSRKPVFVKNNNADEFYIRAGASSEPMTMKESHDYIKAHKEFKSL